MLLTGITTAVAFLAIPELLLWARDIPEGTLWADLSKLFPGTSDPTNSSSAAQATTFFQALNVSAIFASAIGAVAALVARKRFLFVLLTAAVAGPLVVIAPMLWIINEAAIEGTALNPSGKWLVVCALIMTFYWVAGDLTQWSLHPFYRRRLRSAFFVRRAQKVNNGPPTGERGVEEVPAEDMAKFSELDSDGDDFPELIVCAAANVSDKGITPPGRWATPFIFSEKFVGGPLLQTMRTTEFEKAAELIQRPVGLPTAVAVSGAALSPVMGRKTIRAVTFLLALTNIRLGVWLPNPRRIEPDPSPYRVERTPQWVKNRVEKMIALEGDGTQGEVEMPSKLEGSINRSLRWITRPRASPRYLFKELIGQTSIKDRYVYVTDGGHYDNLGIVELLRKGCGTIYCFDAGGDKPGTYEALGEAIALARSDLHIEIEIDPTPINPDPDSGLSDTSFVVGSYRFPSNGSRNGSDSVGHLIYSRATMTEAAPWDLHAFRDRDRRFPNHSTVDQLFNDEKFESYRALGSYSAESALRGKRSWVTNFHCRRTLHARAQDRDVIAASDLHRLLSDELDDLTQAELHAELRNMKNKDDSLSRPSLSLLVQHSTQTGNTADRNLDEVWEYWIGRDFEEVDIAPGRRTTTQTRRRFWRGDP